MIQQIEPVLYLDPQAARPICRCEICGGAIYGPSGLCPRCERRTP